MSPEMIRRAPKPCRAPTGSGSSSSSTGDRHLEIDGIDERHEPVGSRIGRLEVGLPGELSRRRERFRSAELDLARVPRPAGLPRRPGGRGPLGDALLHPRSNRGAALPELTLVRILDDFFGEDRELPRVVVRFPAAVASSPRAATVSRTHRASAQTCRPAGPRKKPTAESRSRKHRSHVTAVDGRLRSARPRSRRSDPKDETQASATTVSRGPPGEALPGPRGNGLSESRCPLK
jgi:hypothetical protein